MRFNEEKVASGDADPRGGAGQTRSPRAKSLIDKLGVKRGFDALVLNVEDAEFWRQLEELAPNVRGVGATDLDIAFFGADSKSELGELRALKRRIKLSGAVWVVFPKGQSRIKLTDVIAAAKAVGLVDTKVVSFSTTHTALKLVVPLARRAE